MAEITAFSARNIAGRERLEDYAVDAKISTAGGLDLHVIMVCDGAGGGEVGELAARLTARTVLGYLEISTEENVPKLLVKAVEEANRIVFGELHGAGTSTIALAAIHLNGANGSSAGQMYIASVGDSHIYLLRDGRLARLNIDHTLANEYAYAGQMSLEEAARLENAEYATRIIGVSPAVQVDIGFYAEKGKSFVNSRRAFRIGQQGMSLKSGDTVFAASDGLFKINEEDGKPILLEEEILRHALDDDVERAGTALLRYASVRHPVDNISLSMLFVPSRDRRAVRVGIGLSRRQKMTVSLVFTFLIALIIIAGLSRLQAGAESETIRETQVAQQATLEAQGGTITVLLYTSTPTPTATPTLTPTVTLTPIPTATFQFENQIGVQFFPPDSPHENVPVLGFVTNVPSNPPEISRMDISGDERRRVPVPLLGYLQPETVIEYLEVNSLPNQESIEMMLYPDGDIFIVSGDFMHQGIEILLAQDERITFGTQVECLAARQITPDPNIEDDPEKVAFSCYTSGVEPFEDNCIYRFSRGEEVEIPIGYRVLLDVEERKVIGTPGPLLYEEVQRYYETIKRLSPRALEENVLGCFRQYLDGDGDDIPDFDDFCPEEANPSGIFGCPDEDGDRFPDRVDVDVAELPGDVIVDVCPDIAGVAEYEGCVATPTPSTTPRVTRTRVPSPTPTVSPSPFPAVCGDGFVNILIGEQCDPPNGNSCDENCRVANVICGDNVCDDTENANNCPSDCNPVCGNDILEGSEECDPPNGDNCIAGCLVDSDGDGTADEADACPDDADKAESEGVCGCGVADTDTDNDGTPDCNDLCPNDAFHDDIGNPCIHNDCPDGSLEDDIGEDPCNHDEDNDGVLDEDDACPLDPNDDVGDPCNHNDCGDGSPMDGVGDPCNHNDCSDGSLRDLIGDPCNHDEDNDGVLDGADNCPRVANPSQTNTYGGPNDQGDACDDTDDDDVNDQVDNCPLVDNTNQINTDNPQPPDPPPPAGTVSDTLGDACDDDDDGDGTDDADDKCPLEYGTATSPPGQVGCPVDDDDGDGVPNDTDNCPSDYNPLQENNYGTPDAEGDVCDDTDGDGENDDVDACPEYFNDGVGDDCVPNDCPDFSLEDGVGDACDHNDCADFTPQDSVGDACIHNDCPDFSLEDSVGDACNHDEDGDGFDDYGADSCPTDPNPPPSPDGCPLPPTPEATPEITPSPIIMLVLRLFRLF